MQQNKATKQQLRNWIDMVSFAAADCNLFLDTHTDNQEALEYFNHFSNLRNKALEEYAVRFTPLTLDTAATCQQKWQWVYGQWPWEGGDC